MLTLDFTRTAWNLLACIGFYSSILFIYFFKKIHWLLLSKFMYEFWDGEDLLSYDAIYFGVHGEFCMPVLYA